MSAPSIPSRPSRPLKRAEKLQARSNGAHVSLVTYNPDGSSSGAGGSVAEGLKFSVEGGLEFTDSTLYSASYFVPGQSFVTWKECLGA